MQNISLGLNVKTLYNNRDLYIKINFIRRTKNADLSVSIPDSVEFDSDAVSIDVIGRGEHRLTDLENQYPGKFAAGCERIVGKGSIEKTNSATLLKTQGLDLRAKNGDDIIIKIKNPFVKGKNVNIKAEATVLTLKENREIEAEAYLETVEPKCGFEKVDLVKLYNLKSGDNITKALQNEIDRLNLLGSGEIHVSEGEYNISSIILKSNVHLYFNKVILKVLPECNNEEKNYYTDETYFPEIDADPADFIELPENYVNWQDNGHAFFENALFFAERCENIKVLGSLTILGMGNITRENEFPSRPEGMHASKTFSIKLCKDVEIGGFSVNKDLWYEEILESGDDEPFYLNDDGTKSDIGIENMMKVTDGGHFIVLATGIDKLYIHDLYATDGTEIRDTLDIMGCTDVVVTNIYSQTAHDDIVKLGSDCSLGFTRKSKNFIVRNIVADTGCNVFQIGSETADDFENICVDNIYVMGCGKSGFSAFACDGASIKNLHFNCGGTLGKCKCGIDHGDLNIGYTPKLTHPHRSIIKRTRMPFHIVISKHGRVLGATKKEFSHATPSGEIIKELVTTNVDIGEIENVYLAHFDSVNSYWGSRAVNNVDNRWPKFTDQERTTPAIMGFKMPEYLNFKFPDGTDVRKVRNIVIEDVNLTAKGGNPESDFQNSPPEQYDRNRGHRKLSGDNRASLIPAYGIYFRHVENLSLKDITTNVEKPDGRKAIVCDNTENVSAINAPEITKR